MDVRVRDTYIRIYDAYQFSKNDFDTCLEYIEDKYNSDVFKYRSRKSLKREWTVHNFLYRNNILRNYTCDVTFESNISRRLEISYMILGFLLYPGIE